MSEEEIFKHLEKMCILDSLCYEVDCLDEKDLQVLRALIDLYNKQKEENNTLKELLQGKLFENYQYYKDLASSYQANCISKDKIRDKIKELESHIWKDGYMTKFDEYAIHYLKELLEED